MPTDAQSLAARPALTARWLVAAAAALALLASLMAFPATGYSAPAKGASVSTATTSLGRVLTTSSGHTLYLFLKDKNGKTIPGEIDCLEINPAVVAGLHADMRQLLGRVDRKLVLIFFAALRTQQAAKLPLRET